MMYKQAKYAIPILAIIFCSCQTVRIYDYFPVHNNEAAIFKKEVDSTKTSSIDTLIRREYSAKTVRNHSGAYYGFKVMNQAFVYDTVQPTSLYCLEKPVLDSAEKTRFYDYSFIGKIWGYRSKRLYIGYEGFKKSGEMDWDLHLLFPKRIRKNADYKDRNGDYWKSYEYIAKEPVEVNGVVYKNCLKIDVFETFGSSKRIGTIWLAKHIGLVKWEVKNEKVAFRHSMPTDEHGWESHKAFNWQYQPPPLPPPNPHAIP